MALIPGTRFGVYEVSAHIGEGGMGQVYRARDTKLNRDVALKILPDLFAGDPDRLARFRREAQVLASLNHPNIAQIYGLEEVGSVPPAGETRPPGHAPPLEALVLELVEGPTLADRIARGPIPPSDALPIARQIADALDAAHELGIVHRDLKPANVKVRDDDAVKVLDFGLAKALGTEPASAAADAMHSPTLTARATGLGVILGTAAYMAPEQAKGRPVDRRADIWAFGCVLYEMLTGRRAFQGADVSDTLAAVLRQDVDWTALPTSVPASIRRLLARCLERDPKKRLRDIGEARLILENPISTAAGEDAPVPAGPIARRALPWAIAAASVIAAAVGWWGSLHPAAMPPRAVTRSTMIFPSDTLASDLALSHDGKQLVYWERAPTGRHLALRAMDQLEGRPIPGTDDGDYPVFSPDGQWIAYIADAKSPHPKIEKIPVTGGTSIPLCDADYADTLTWGDDDTIVFAAKQGLMRVPASGGTPELLTTTKDSPDFDPQFLPGAQGLLFTILTPSSALHIGLLDLKTRSVRILPGTGENARYLATGHLVYWRDNALFAVPFDVKTQSETGSETPVVEDVSEVGYAFSDAGLLVFKTGNDAPVADSLLEWRNRLGIGQLLPGPPRGWFEMAVSPDGKLVAATILEPGKTGEADSTDIWRYDIARDTLTRLTFDGASRRPLWTPDGKWVTFASFHDGAHIARVPADASGPARVLVPVAENMFVAPWSWTPDGKSLLYMRRDARDSPPRSEIWILSADGTPRRVLDTTFSEGEAQVSPDGKWLAYDSDESGRLEVYVVPFPGPGGKVQISTQGVAAFHWSRNGQELIYSETLVHKGAQNESQLMSVDMRTLPPGRPEPLFTFPLASLRLWDVTPNPQRFLVTRRATPTVAPISTFVVVTDWFEELRRRAPVKPGR